MRRRDKAGKAIKTRRHKTLKRRNTAKIARRHRPSAVDTTDTIAQLTRERDEALEQQAATSDVLRVVSSSSGELKLVFLAMLDNATRICEAKFGTLFLYDGNAFRFAADVGAPVEYTDFQTKRGLFQTTPGSQLDQVLKTKRVSHTPDYSTEQVVGVSGKLGGARSSVSVPMLKDSALVGAISIFRQEVRPFTDKQIALLENFASQAVIAIENARLLNELRETLERQAATSEVLQVISSSPGELQPVFDTLLSKATELCDASYGALWLRHGDGYRFGALFGDLPQQWRDCLHNQTIFRVKPEVPLARIALSRKPLQIANLRTDPSYLSGDQLPVSGVDIGGIETLAVVPMFKDDQMAGAIAIYRKEVRPFADKQIELLSNFAAQAVIAIENTRLFSELRETLERQTATSEVLKVISSSPGELEPVFNAMLQNAVRICGAKCGTLFLSESEGTARAVAQFGATSSYAEDLKQRPVIALGEGALGRCARTKQPVQIADVQADPAYLNDPPRLAIMKLNGARTMFNVPMLKDNEVIGQIAIYRQEILPFTDKQVELMQNFAAQAVIAIENARLLNELHQRTDDLSVSLEDLRTAQDRLVQTEKLASLGQLTAGIAHEIKNPLNFINNFSSVSVELIDELRTALDGANLDNKRRAEISEIADMLQGNLDKVVQHGKRADSIVKNMLLHSRQGSGEHRPIDINTLVEESLNLAYHGARAEKQGFNITLEKSFDPAAGEADLFPQEITRVLLNLISNGFYAATKRKADTNGVEYEPKLAAATKNLGDRVEIRIRDNGTGIPLEVKDKMFNPFFTTKPAGEGAGLGLSISHDIIVKQHGGSIEVDTQPSEFTEFKIILPRKGASLAKSGERP